MLARDKTPEAEVNNGDQNQHFFPLNSTVLPLSAISELAGGLILQ